MDDDHVALICEALLEHDGEFVVIGGVAARLHGTGHATVDIDVCPAIGDSNLERLASALVELNARLRVEGEPNGIPFDPHPDSLGRAATMTLITDHGPLDLCFAPAGIGDGYSELVAGASSVPLATVLVPVASLADVVRSKRSAGRAKDIVALPALERRLRELEG